MEHRQWGMLARVQDELAMTEDLKRKQREHHHKMLYRDQLQRIIQQRKLSQHALQTQKRAYQKRSLNLVVQTPNMKQQLQKQNMVKVDQHARLSWLYNLQHSTEAKNRMSSQYQVEKNVDREKFRKVETELSEEKYRYIVDVGKRKREFARVYQEQINGIQNKKHLEKLENFKFQQLARQLEEKKERELLEAVNKIKQVYNKNKQSYQKTKQLYARNQSTKYQFLAKQSLLTNKQQADLKQQTKKLKLHSNSVQTSKFNKNVYEDRAFRRKQLFMNQLQQDQRKMSHRNQRMAEQQQMQRLKQVNSQWQLKSQLERQISQAYVNRQQCKRMNDREKQINHIYFKHNTHLMIPGLDKDSSEIKKEHIIAHFLRNPTLPLYL